MNRASQAKCNRFSKQRIPAFAGNRTVIKVDFSPYDAYYAGIPVTAPSMDDDVSPERDDVLTVSSNIAVRALYPLVSCNPLISAATRCRSGGHMTQINLEWISYREPHRELLNRHPVRRGSAT